jgi:hypothetical protein
MTLRVLPSFQRKLECTAPTDIGIDPSGTHVFSQGGSSPIVIVAMIIKAEWVPAFAGKTANLTFQVLNGLRKAVAPTLALPSVPGMME